MSTIGCTYIVLSLIVLTVVGLTTGPLGFLVAFIVLGALHPREETD